MNNTKLINLNPTFKTQNNHIIKYNDNYIYDINSKINFYLPYKDIFNSKIFKNQNQIIVCYSKLKSRIFSRVQQQYSWRIWCYNNYTQVLNYLFFHCGLQIFYMKNFLNNYYVIDNGYIGVVNNNYKINDDETINVKALMCLCLKSNNLVDFANNKQQDIIDNKHFVLLIDHSFPIFYPLVFKKIYKEYIQNFINEGYDILYTDIEEKIYNTDNIIDKDFKNMDELFNYLDSFNDELKQM